METNTPQLTTAAGILDAYMKAVRNVLHSPNADNSESLKNIVRLFATRPIDEFVTACAARKEFDFAVTLLDAAYYRNNPGSTEDRELAKIGLGMVDVCLVEKRFNIAEWALKRAYDIYSSKSPERRQVVEKGISIVEDCLAANELGFADDILKRSFDIYPVGSAERRQVVEKRAEIANKLRASRKMGTKQTVVVGVAKGPTRKNVLGTVAVAS